MMNCSVLWRFHQKVAILQIAKRCIAGKELRQSWPVIPKPPPFPYKQKRFMPWHLLFENTSDRMDENSKIIVVEGPIASGKTKLAKALAEEFGMLYMPEVNFNMLYLDKYGFDYRSLNHLLPNSLKRFDIPDFHRDPYDNNVHMMQLHMYVMRYWQYIDALGHLFSTGQGIVMERSAYSDPVFINTMHKFGYIRTNVLRFYNALRNNTIVELKRPHLIIYLDVPVPEVKKRILQRNRPFEVTSEVFSEPFLETMEQNYRQMLKELTVHSELLTYDWSNYGDVETIVEDIERIDFDHYEKHGKKMADWYIFDESEWNELRRLYADDYARLYSLINVIHFDVPELFVDPDDQIKNDLILDEYVPNKYQYGYNKNKGESYLFKMDKFYERETLPIIEHNYDDVK